MGGLGHSNTRRTGIEASDADRHDSFSDLEDVPGELAALVADLAGAPVGGRIPQAEVSNAPLQVGRYTVFHRVARGGMGEVYSAYDRELDRKVALKLVRGTLGASSPSAMRRIRREAQALAKVSHPNVVAVHEVGVHRPEAPAGPLAMTGGFVYIAMEFITGTTLRQWCTARPRTAREILDAIVQVGRGLAAVHAAGLVHRDLKPENIMVGDDGRVRLTDFGVARREVVEEALASGRPDDESSRRRGRLLGTPGYMAPEQLESPDVGPAADQFALGVVAWEAFYGARPFVGASVSALREALRTGRKVPPRRPRAMPGRVRRVVERALAIDPAARWPDVTTMVDQLTAPSRKWWLVPAGLAACAAAAFGLVDLAPSACEDRQAQLGGIWDEERRVAMGTAMTASGAAFAESAWRSASAGLDASADAWMKAFTGACERREAGWSEQLRAAQAACLAEHKQALATASDVLTSDDAEVIGRVHQVIGGLPSVEACTDRVRLAAQQDRGYERSVLTAAHAVWSDLARIRVMNDAGAWSEAAPLAAAAVERAHSLGHEPLLAQALVERGRVAGARRDHGAAHDDLREAYRVAMSAGDDATAAVAAVLLTRLVGIAMEQPAEGLQWGFHAEALLGRSDRPELPSDLAVAVAEIHLARGDSAAAVTKYRAALRLLERRQAGRTLAAAAALDGLAKAHALAGDDPASRAAAATALEIRRELLSTEHPAVATASTVRASDVGDG